MINITRIGICYTIGIENDNLYSYLLETTYPSLMEAICNLNRFKKLIRLIDILKEKTIVVTKEQFQAPQEKTCWFSFQQMMIKYI